MATAESTLQDDGTIVRALTGMVRVMFPHPSFPDGPYERCARAIVEASHADVRMRAQLEQGLRDLDVIGGAPFAELPPEQALELLRSISSTTFFAAVRGQVITSLYDDREVWTLLGYEGPSYDQGGYLNRGFDDLDWLPDPKIEQEAGSMTHHGNGAATSHTTRFGLDDSDVVVIIGSGAGGGTLANELCQQGIRTVVLEAGPHLTGEDYVNDEWPAFNQMAWLDQRTTSGSWRVARDFPNLPAWTVKAVGGTTTHWAGACPRFKDYEFKTKSHYSGIDGANLLDWPIALQDLEPFYDQAERRMGVTHVHGRPPLPANNNYKVFANGAERVGYKGVQTGPYATNAEPYDGRPATIQDGFNFQGDKRGSKWSTLVAELPKAEKTGNLDLRPDCHVVQITHDAGGHADAVLYLDSQGNLQRQRAKIVCVAGNAIETARLLLLSASPLHPDGLANSSGQVGRNYMRHLTASVYGRFDKPVNFHRGETMAGVISDESGHDDGRGFAGGFYFETLALGPSFLAAFADPGAWGPDFTAVMDAYQNTAGMWIVGEDMPQESNAVTLNTSVTDQHGLPVPNVHFDDHANDLAMREYAWAKGSAVYEAVGATASQHTPPYPSTHNMGTARMSARPEDGVVDAHGRAHDIPNLYVSDGSVFTTGAAANPTLTIVALAIRQGQHIGEQIRSGATAKVPAAA